MCLKRACNAALALLVLLSQGSQPAAYAQQSTSVSSSNFSADYTRITKKILIAGIEIERFSLKYRLESAKPPRFRRLRFFLTQEAGAAGGLAYEIIAVDQFNVGRHHPLRVDKQALRNGLKTTTITSTIAASGSAFELAANFMQAMKNRKNGYSQHDANKFVALKVKEIDGLLAERDTLVASLPDDAARQRAQLEGKMLRTMRTAFLNEYVQFSGDVRSLHAFQNTFFFLNAATNAVGAAAGGVGYRSVSRPSVTGTANILFIVTGALASTTPMISTAAGALARKRARSSLEKLMHEKPDDNLEGLTADRKLLEASLQGETGTLMPSLPATKRFALYTESADLFQKQLANETHTMRKLDKVALQSGILAPAIGGTLVTQGILGCEAFYKYPLRPRKNLGINYAGAVTGLVGASVNVVGNAAFLLASYSYEHRLYKDKRLPKQLIEARLQHLDDVEKEIAAL